MNRYGCIRLAVVAAWFGLSLCADVYKYDFSNGKGRVQEDFTGVTAASGEDCRWLAGTVKGDFQEYRDKDAAGSGAVPTRYPIDLSAGHVRGVGDASFVLPKVAPGTYHVWALCGFGGGPAKQVWDVRLSIGASGEHLTFQGSDEIMEMDFEAVVGEGGMAVSIASRGHWVLNGLVAVPANEWKAARDGWLKDLREEIFILPKAVRSKWQYRPVACVDPEPVWNERQRADGMAVYTRNWATPIWPDHFPKQSELDAPVRAFASWGEREILNFAVYPLRDFENVTISVSDLVHEDGRERILPEDVDVRYVRYMYVRPNYIVQGIYYRAPDVLMPYRKPLRMSKGENLRFWLTVRVPLKTPAGFYRGAATVTADGVSVQVPLTLRVLPITLTRDESLVFGQYYRSPLDWLRGLEDSFSRRWNEVRNEKEHAFMRECGHRVHPIHISLKREGDHFVPDLDAFQRQVDTCFKYGLDAPTPTQFGLGSIYRKYMKADMGSHIAAVKMPPQEFFDEVTRLVGIIHREAVRRQWPELLFYPVDEPSSAKNSVDFMVKTLAAIKAVPGVRTYVTAEVSNEEFAPMKPYVDVWCGQAFGLPREQALAEMAAKPGLEFWAYPNHVSGENDHTPCLGARMTYGFGFWQSGYRCLIPWIFGISTGSQWNYLDARTADFVNRYDMDGSVIPVALWAAYMEGMDDGRYLNTLEKLVSRAQDEGRTALAEDGRKTLEFIRSSIRIQPKYKTDDTLWPADSFDAYRWLLATKILEMQQKF